MLFFTVEFQLIKTERLVDLENQLLAVTIVTIISGRHHQWLLKPEDESMVKNDMLTLSQSISHNILINFKEKNSIFTWIKLPYDTCDTVNITSNGTHRHYVPPEKNIIAFI